jgi:hypothetical protein
MTISKHLFFIFASISLQAAELQKLLEVSDSIPDVFVVDTQGIIRFAHEINQY